MNDINTNDRAVLDMTIESADHADVSVGEVIIHNPTDYEKLKNKPKVNGTELTGNKTLEELGEATISYSEIRNSVDKAINMIFGG